MRFHLHQKLKRVFKMQTMSQYIVWISATDHYRDKHAICLKMKKQNYFTKRIKPELIRIIMYVFSLQKKL